MSPIIIFDLDGTLININSIQHLIGDWDKFADASTMCPPVINMVKFALQCQKIADLVILTGRTERLIEATHRQLSSLGIFPVALKMRPLLDSRPDGELKMGLLKNHLIETRGPLSVFWKDLILFAVEDRDKSVESWRAEGITCLQCAPSLY